MVLLLDTNANGVYRRLVEKIRQTHAGDELEIFQTIDSICSRLNSLAGGLSSIVILRAHNREQLRSFQKIKKLYDDCKVLLVLPDNEKRTLTCSHHLRPRFLTFEDSSFDDLASVVEKMWRKEH